MIEDKDLSAWAPALVVVAVLLIFGILGVCQIKDLGEKFVSAKIENDSSIAKSTARLADAAEEALRRDALTRSAFSIRLDTKTKLFPRVCADDAGDMMPCPDR